MNKRIDLINDWFYNRTYDAGMERNNSVEGMESVHLPHTNVELPYSYFDETVFQFISCYKKVFISPDLRKDQIVRIRFDGVMACAKVYLNGAFLGEHLGGYTPFAFEIQDLVKEQDENVLTVVVDSTERPDVPPFGGQIDYLTYGGIYREVYLEIMEPLFIDNVKAEAMNVLEPVKGLKLDIYLDNRNVESSFEVEVVAIIKNPACESISRVEERVTVQSGRQIKTIEINVLKDIQLWDIDNPVLYRVDVEIRQGRQVDRFSIRVGFRDCAFTPNGFFLNGRVVKLMGMNRHQAFPYVGYAMPKRAQIKDADIIKQELHCNLVRTSHYPQSIHFLDRCDEIGLLVFEEIPGWQHIGDESWKNVALQNVGEMIERDWNHPSIIIWGVRINESADDDAFYEKTNKLAHELDKTRQTGGVRTINNSRLLEDVYTMNDFVNNGNGTALCDQRSITGLPMTVPYLVTEYNGHMYPTKKADNEERQMEHVLRHLRVLEASWSDSSISGAIAWCAFDYNTHKDFGSGDRICHHGVMDMFRIPKFAAYVYKSQTSPEVETVLEPVTYWARGERSVGGILPLVILSNCDWIDIQYGEFEPIPVMNKAEGFKHLPYPPFIVDFSAMPPEKIGQWGMKWEDGIITGYVGNKPVKTVKFAKNPIPERFIMISDDNLLCAGSKDVTRIVVKLVDRYDRPLPFIHAAAKVKVNGPARILGPSELVLDGGSTGFWIESNGEPGEILVTAFCGEFEAESCIITVV